MLGDDRRALRGLHNLLVDVIIAVARNEFPLTTPPPLAVGIIFDGEPRGGSQDAGQV